MPAQSTLSSDDKSKVKAAVPNNSNKIHTAALARIYYAHPNPNEWSYAGLQGALAFIHDKSKGALYLRMVDLAGTRGVIWQHELYEGLEYFQDRPFFHSFPGDECMIGIVFAEESEAKTFYKKVTTTKVGTEKPKSSNKKKASKGGKIDKSMISGPTSGSFQHVAHMGYDPVKGFTSSNVDPSWSAFLSQLEGHGLSREVLEQNMDFIKDFVRDAQKSAPAPPAAKKKPPPPPAPRGMPPPPPPPPPAGGSPGPSAGLPAPAPGRDALLASIQSAGVHMLRKTDPNATPARPTSPPAEESASSSGGGGGGGDLTAALAAALLERNKKLGDSDEEEDDDDDWD
ncbi:predicted protein [Postia placenta Mad-698-R]|uniref:WH1 domain-containing protein n=1 Tax=Postia placenta MAD-698-R-SB12 TaxID=670580 RepID=A0A1X6N0D5_9APHY|nr:hypothetical protein POSPLADRAFT_1142414 [Postia placenta MAD-698-R-SB12]EED80968.1 predicted protein [Postia placenta Mad-698-R]OSX62075.1 hypothetical protein POSPLADRAFT_1142414 [Postia placenta MAD-698-R-SB12]